MMDDEWLQLSREGAALWETALRNRTRSRHTPESWHFPEVSQSPSELPPRLTGGLPPIQHSFPYILGHFDCFKWANDSKSRGPQVSSNKVSALTSVCPQMTMNMLSQSSHCHPGQDGGRSPQISPRPWPPSQAPLEARPRGAARRSFPCFPARWQGMQPPHLALGPTFHGEKRSSTFIRGEKSCIISKCT